MVFDFSCDIGHIKNDVPHQIWEAITGGGQIPPLVSRFLHSKPSFYASDLLHCYLSYFSPEFLNKTFTVFGLILFGLGFWHLVVNKQWRIIVLVLFAPLVPLMDFPNNGFIQTVILYSASVLVMLFGVKNLLTWLKIAVRDSISFFALCTSLPLFFYNLGAYSLVDFDEAWYAEIARNILRLHQPIFLFFNGHPYLDHPPLGFNLMAFSFFMFGTNEWAARFPSATLGFGCLVLVYLIGKNLFNRLVGFASAAMLASSVWFIFRAREADLDVPFLFFYLLCVLAAAKVKSNPSWLYVLAIAFAAVLQMKSAIGVSVLPAVFILLALARRKLNIKRIAIAAALFMTFLLPWLVPNLMVFGTGFINGLLATGLRFGHQTLFNSLALTYLHNGIGKWYYPALIVLPVSLLFIRRKPQLAALLATTLLLLFGFLTNTKTEIWHLLPLYPFLFLILSAVVFEIFSLRLFRYPLIILIVIIASWQIGSFRHNIRLTDFGNSDLVKVSLVAKNRSEPLYLGNQDFFPSTVFYSEKQVIFEKAAFPPPDNSLIGIVAKAPRPFLLITEDWRLKIDNIDLENYQLLAQSGSWVLLQFDKR